MVRTQIQLTEAQHEALKKMAEHTGRSMAELIRDGVELVLEGATASPHAEARLRALRIVGRYRSDVSDLGSRHDDYLEEAFDA